MLYYALKVVISALLIVAISEIAKRSTGFAALIASLPLTSLLAFVWLKAEGSSPGLIAELASQIFWLVIPSLVLFIALPLLLRQWLNFWISLAISVARRRAKALVHDSVMAPDASLRFFDCDTAWRQPQGLQAH